MPHTVADVAHDVDIVLAANAALKPSHAGLSRAMRIHSSWGAPSAVAQHTTPIPEPLLCLDILRLPTKECKLCPRKLLCQSREKTAAGVATASRRTGSNETPNRWPLGRKLPEGGGGGAQGPEAIAPRLQRPILKRRQAERHACGTLGPASTHASDGHRATAHARCAPARSHPKAQLRPELGGRSPERTSSFAHAREARARASP